jgi:hypothetical protein
MEVTVGTIVPALLLVHNSSVNTLNSRIYRKTARLDALNEESISFLFQQLNDDSLVVQPIA